MARIVRALTISVTYGLNYEHVMVRAAHLDFRGWTGT